MRSMAKDWRLAVLTLYGIVVLICMVHMGQPDGARWWLMGVPFMGWALAPVALLCLKCSHPLAYGIGAAILALLGAWLYIGTAYSSAPDAQAGLVFVFLPLYQLGFAAIWIGLVYGWAKFTKGHDT